MAKMYGDLHKKSPYTMYLTPKRFVAGDLYSEGARCTPSVTSMARHKLISAFSRKTPL